MTLASAAATSLALALGLAACTSATCPNGRVGGTGACISDNASTAADSGRHDPAPPFAAASDDSSDAG